MSTVSSIFDTHTVKIQDLLSCIVDNSIDAIVLLQPLKEDGVIVDFEYLHVNPSACGMLGKSAEELIGERVLKLYPGTKDEGMFELYTQVVQHGLSFDKKFYYQHDGLRNWFRQLGLRIENDLLVVITSDITKTIELHKINSDLDNFIYSASHDLKAPVTNIELLLSILTESIDPELKKDSNISAVIGMLNASVNRFKKTIEELGNIARIYNHEKESKTLISVGEVIEFVLLDLENLIKTNNAKVEVKIEPGLNIQFSKANLSSLMQNLITNSIKYKSPDRNPDILIRSYSQDGYVVIEVEDNGMGIHEKDFSKIFSVYQRLHQHVDGSGIGLYIVKRIVEGNGGKISVKSELNKGTTFQIMLKNN